MRPVKSKELRFTLGDYEAMAHLGNYYAEKILVEKGEPGQDEKLAEAVREEHERY